MTRTTQLALALVAGFGLSNEVLAGHCGGGVVTVGGPSAMIASPPQAFYGGFASVPQTASQQTVQAASRVDNGVVQTAYQEPLGATDATSRAASTSPQPPASTPAAATYVPQIPVGAINYNDNGYYYMSPAAILTPAPEGPTSGHGRRWIRFYFPPGMTYFHDQGYGY